MKTDRQSAILDIIETIDVETQEQLLSLLEERGFSTTQATISRDIKNLHIIKEQTAAGQYRYVVSYRKTAKNIAGKLQNIFKEGVISIETAQNILVVKTMPGLASAACAALDGMDIPDMMGSLAGDDTGILIMRTNEAAEAFQHEIKEMLK